MKPRHQEPPTTRRVNPTEIIRCLLHDGFTLESGARYCRTIALNARYNAFRVEGDSEAYTEAAERLEARAKAEKLALEHVEDLERSVDEQGRHILELQRNIVAMQNEIERLKSHTGALQQEA